MTKSHSMRPVLLCIGLALIAGCASQSPRYFTLSGPGTVPASNPSELSVAVGPVTVPTLVDRPQIVIGVGVNQVRFDDLNRWAGPLADEVSRAIQSNLAQQLGTTRVWTQMVVGHQVPDMRVALDVQRFETWPGDAAVIDVLWVVQRVAGGPARTGRSLVREASTAPGVEPAVAAHSRALARVSADIAAAIRAQSTNTAESAR